MERAHTKKSAGELNEAQKAYARFELELDDRQGTKQRYTICLLHPLLNVRKSFFYFALHQLWLIHPDFCL